MIKKIPFIFSALSIFGGLFIAILFGVNEAYFKNKISRDLQTNQKVLEIINVEKKAAFVKKEAGKNWRYYQRFHFHATAIGSMSVAILVLLQFICAPAKFLLLTSYFIGVGGFFYPFVWLFAAIYGPVMGREEAKEAFAFFAYGGGLYLVGIVFLIFLILKYPLDFKNKEIKEE
jgi:hypothetical protein